MGKRWTTFKGLAAIALFAAVLLMPQAAWAGYFTGAYITDINGNLINGDNPVDFETLSQGIVFHLGPDADSSSIYHSGNIRTGLAHGTLNLETGCYLTQGLGENAIHDLPGNKAAGYQVFYPRNLQPGKQYSFRLFLDRMIGNQYKFEYGYFETFEVSFSTSGGEEGSGGDDGWVAGGATLPGTGAQGGAGTSADGGPVPGAGGGEGTADPDRDADEVLAEAGISDDAASNAQEWIAGGLGAAAARGTVDPRESGSPADASSPTGASAAAAAFREAAAGSEDPSRDASFGEGGEPLTGREVTGEELASMGQVHAISGARDAEMVPEQVEEAALDALVVTGYPLLWVMIVGALALALPAGALIRLTASAVLTRTPTRLGA